MENKYWIFILIGIMILACIGLFFSYKYGVKEGSNSGYDEGFVDGFQSYGHCTEICARGFIDSGYENIVKISIGCMENCIQGYIGVAKMS